MHGKDINKDAYKAARIGRVGVDHFALAALHNRIAYENRLDEFADYLVREVIELEGEQFDAMDEKFQVFCVTLHTVVNFLFSGTTRSKADSSLSLAEFTRSCRSRGDILLQTQY
jgi:hypothetical protein